MMFPELALTLFWTAAYAATGAMIALSDHAPTGDDLALWSGAYGATGAWFSSLLLLFPMSH